MNGSESNPMSDMGAVRLRKANLLLRLAAIALLLLATVGLFLYAGGWLTPHALTPASMVNTFEYLNGVHSGFRRNHAKGVCVTGFFESNGQVQALSKALVFVPGRVPVVGRFAFAGGQPYAGDSEKTVRSLAILFKQSDGQEWRTAMINVPVFLVNTPQAFHDFMLASSPNLIKQFAAGNSLHLLRLTPGVALSAGGRPGGHNRNRRYRSRHISRRASYSTSLSSVPTAVAICRYSCLGTSPQARASEYTRSRQSAE